MKSTYRMVRGFSLIEVMIALAIGLFLLLGLIQVFAASKTAYQVSEGLARVQENGRFAIDYLQRDIRMAGHYGCVNDQSRLLPQGVADPFLSHLSGADGRVAFGQSMQAYEATGTAPGATLSLAAPTATWSPGLPTYISALNPKAGSDIIVLRFFAPEGVPVQTITSTPGQTTITVLPSKWPTFTKEGVTAPSLFAVADCSYADVFQASSTTPASGTVVFNTSTGLNSAVDFTERYTGSPSGQTSLYRAESVVYYVADGASGEPSLFRYRFNPAPGAGLAAAQPPEELVEGVENLQFLFGSDANPVNSLNGNVTEQNVASALATTEINWRRVGLVQVGVLARSPTPASAGNATAANAGLVALGLQLTPPADRRYRSVYESSIAERNRLYGN